MAKKEEKRVAPFGIQFLETPSARELESVNGGRRHHKHGITLHSMDIFTSQGVTHYNT